MCHDIGKVKEISAFPVNDYTDDGQLLGHIVMGAQMVGERAAKIDGFLTICWQNYSIVFWRITVNWNTAPQRCRR